MGEILVQEVILVATKEPRDIKQGISVDTKVAVRQWLRDEFGWENSSVIALKSLETTFLFRCQKVRV